MTAPTKSARLVPGVCVSLLLLLARTSRPHLALLAPVAKTEPGQQAGMAWVDTHPDVQPRAGVLVVRVEASLVFSNAEYVRDRIRALVEGMTPAPRLVVIDGQTTPSVDVTAAAMLTQLRGDLQRVGSDLALAHSIGQVRDVLSTAEAGHEPPIYASIEDALAAPPPPVHE